MTAAAPIISLQGAGVRFGELQALRDVNLQLHRGDRVALVGANGSGKTTLLKLLNGLVAHDGRRELHTLESGRRPVAAMLFQRPFLMRLSVLNNLRLAFWLAGVPPAERAARAAASLARVGLTGLESRPARSLSGGQQQRLALARAWGTRPDLLFLDEPTASLDPSAKREVEALVMEFARDGMTVVMSTHNLGQAKRLATRVAYLDAGRLAVDLPTERFFDPAVPHDAAHFLKGELAWQ
jgi:tungstate transport system ATP-binding protein